MSGPVRQATFGLHRAVLGHTHASAAFQPIRTLSTPLRQQKRYARVADIRFVQTAPPNIAQKYQHLLEKKAKSEGLGSVDELKEAYKPRIDEYKRSSLTAPELPGDLQHAGISPSPLSSTVPQNPTPSTQSPSPFTPSKPPQIPRTTTQKHLSSFVSIPKILEHTPEEIEYIWRARHVSSSTSLCAIIPTETYSRMTALARQHPMFILPLPRENQGVELHFMQWQFTSQTTTNVIFTSLIEYKLRGEFATPHTTVTHHSDISDEKGIVLLQGQVKENGGVSVEEAKWLLMALQKFYGIAETGTEQAAEEVGRRRDLLRMFSEGREDFDVQRLIKEVETIS